MVQDGQTQPQFDFAQAIEQIVFVETTLDSDRDGRLARVRIQVRPPSGTRPTLHPSDSLISLPIVGGAGGLGF